jgi:hypothetical protein
MSRSKKILFAGFEIGGQMQLMAETVRKRWIPATSVAYNHDFRGYQNDINLSDNNRGSIPKRLAFFIWALMHYDVFHFFWGVSLFGFWRFHLLDLPILKFFGKKIIVHFRGLDVVDIKYFDYLRERARGNFDIVCPPVSRQDQVKLLNKWIKYSDLILVSEPDLHFVSDKSILSPQVIDTTYWTTNRVPKSFDDGIIRLVHAPSSRRKKGTDFIEEAIDLLQKEGLKIELVLAENLPHNKIKELYEICDIGVDQVLYGWHGKASVEMMSLGMPVICNIDHKYRKFRPDLPIIHADPSCLKDVIRNLVCDFELRRRIGEESKVYAKKYHDIEIVIDDLLSMYGFENKSNVKSEIIEARKW